MRTIFFNASACLRNRFLAVALLLMLLLAGCFSPVKKLNARLPSLRSQWTSNLTHQAALPEQKADWPAAVSLLRARNLKLLAGRLDITNNQEAVRQVFKDLIPTLDLRANVNRSLRSLGTTSFDDVTFSVD